MKNFPLPLISAFLFYSLGFTTAHAESVTSQEPAIMTIGEMGILKRQVARCWNPPLGHGMYIVTLGVDVNPDRTVQDVGILDKSSYDNDPSYQSAANAAIRAIRNPKCNPLDLPPEKYDQWKHIELTFDPRDML